VSLLGGMAWWNIPGYRYGLSARRGAHSTSLVLPRATSKSFCHITMIDKVGHETLEFMLIWMKLVAPAASRPSSSRGHPLQWPPVLQTVVSCVRSGVCRRQQRRHPWRPRPGREGTMRRTLHPVWCVARCTSPALPSRRRTVRAPCASGIARPRGLRP
jgi:hypothetical protein